MRENAKKSLDESVLYFYGNAFQSLTFPIDPIFIIKRLDKCRYISYAKLAEKSGRSVFDVIKACCSSDGCTHYDPRLNRYLIAVNESGRSKARIRWTMAHELGHIAAGHFVELVNNGLAIPPADLPYMEEEADYFAASFLAPFPAIRDLHANNADDIRLWFGLSRIAAGHRWEEYQQHAGEPSPFDDFFYKHKARSATKKPTGILNKPISVWADEPL